MIVDHIKNISQYPQLAAYAKEITAFAEKCRREALPAGRYDLLADGALFALVQYYEARPKEKGRMESHIEYIDLQYIQSGREVIYYALTEELTVAEDKRPEKDVIFYEEQPDRGGVLLTEGMFGYYAPQDAHMPCIRCGDAAEEVAKIVFKIRVLAAQ